MVNGTRRGGRHLPAEAGDYTHLDDFGAELAFELLTLIKTRYGTFSDFLRDRMADPTAPHCIAGDPSDRKEFGDAKRAMSKQLGRAARTIVEWELAEFVLGPTDSDEHRALRTRLAGLWQASQRYPPPGYRGPVHLPDGAPPPYACIDEAPNDKVRVQMLVSQLSQERDNSQRVADEAIRELREAHELSWQFYEGENAELRRRLEHYRECERLAIRIIAWQEQQLERDRSAVERELRDEAIRLRRQVEELTVRLNRERAAHNLTTNRFAFIAACFDAVSAEGDTDPMRWLRDADFALGAGLYALLSHPTTTRARAETMDRFLTVFVRTYLLSWYGDAPDDTVGPYRAIVRDGVLPPMDVLRNLLASHSITLQVARPLIQNLVRRQVGT